MMPAPRLAPVLLASAALHTAALLLHPAHQPGTERFAAPLAVVLAPASHGERETVTDKAAGKAVPVQAGPQTAAPRQAPSPSPVRQPRQSPRPAVAARQPADTGAGSSQSAQPATASRPADLEQRLLASLHEALLPHFSYPLLARRRGWEGIVRVGLRIESNGSITHLHLVTPSPHRVLNDAAVRSLARLARLPEAGNWLQGGHVDIVLPVEYRLLEG